MDAPAWDQPYSPEEELDRAGFDECDLDALVAGTYDADGNLRTPSRTEGEEGLSSYLVDRWMKGHAIAREVCTISYWASAAGATGFVRTLAFRPDAPTGHFARHLKTVLRIDHVARGHMRIAVPAFNKAAFSRDTLSLPVVPVFEALARELEEDPGMQDRLQDMVDQESLPPLVTEHCLFKASKGKSLPTVLYVDGVPTTKSESLLGFWIYCLVSAKRHLVCVLRKTSLCQCGCKGWDTVWHVMKWLNWCFLALASGEYPSCKHDGKPWDAEDPRHHRGGSPLGFCACLVAVKGDWAEYCHTFGFPNRRTAASPCPHCLCTVADMHEDEGLNPTSTPWADCDQSQYDEAAARCEVHVLLDEEGHRKVKANLIYDASRTGNKGRVLSADIPELTLRAGDRLEPCDGVPVTGDGFDTASAPVAASFWRTSAETKTKHRNPLFNSNIGITTAILLIDLLHVFYLGILQTFCMDMVWELILCDAWQVGAASRLLDTLVSTSVRLLCLELDSFYAAWHREHPGQQLTVVQHFVPSMIGSKDSRCLKLKAAETKGFFFFLVQTLARRGVCLTRPDVWSQGAGALRGIIDVLKTAPMNLSARQYQELAIGSGRGGVVDTSNGATIIDMACAYITPCDVCRIHKRMIP